MSILRCYSKREWIPENWDRCSNCIDGVVTDEIPTRRCTMCDGYGSLKAAALAHLRIVRPPAPYSPGQRGAHPRCEDCGHPMGEGTWEWSGIDRPIAEYDPENCREGGLSVAMAMLGRGIEPSGPGYPVHYSPCDKGCRHDGPGRQPCSTEVVASGWIGCNELMVNVGITKGFQASWRPVDVRRLSWDHDLRPEYLAVLCLRCWAARYGCR